MSSDVSAAQYSPPYRPLVLRYYGFQLFFSLLIWLPIFYEYQIRIGLTAAEIFSIQSVYYLVFCLLEIPTGVLADRIGYKPCMIWGAVALVIANLAAIYMQSYTGMTIHFLLIALARSLISGSSSAYLYDSLAHMNRVDEYKVIEGKARSYGLVAKVIAWAGVGSYLNSFLTLPYWLTVGAAVISVGYALSLPQLVIQTTRVSLLPGLREALKLVASNRLLFYVILQGIGLFVLARIVQVNLFQPILRSKSFEVASFGWIMSVMTLFEAFGSYYPGLLRRVAGNLAAVFLLTVVLAATLAVMPISGQAGTLVALSIFSLVVGLSFPIQKQLINDLIPAAGFRATVLSLESIVDRAICAVVAALLGSSLSSETTGLNYFLFISAAVTAVGILVLYVVTTRLNKKLSEAAPT